VRPAAGGGPLVATAVACQLQWRTFPGDSWLWRLLAMACSRQQLCWNAAAALTFHHVYAGVSLHKYKYGRSVHAFV
jgi:hypothetical protein